MAKKKSLAAGRRALALVLAFSLIITMASAPLAGPVGQVEASHAECTQTDEFLWTFTLGYLNNPLALNQQCDPSALSQHATDLEELHANATKTDIYNTGSQTKADSDQFLGVMGNYLQDSGTPAMAKAEAAAVAAIDANESRSAVEQAAVDAVEDYYARKQMNLVDQWNVAASTAWTMENTSDEAGISDDFVRLRLTSSKNTGTYEYPLQPIDSGTTSLTMVNGTSYQAVTLTLLAYDHVNNEQETSTITIHHGETAVGTSADFTTVDGVEVAAFDTFSSQMALHFPSYKSEWDALQSKESQVEANAEAYASSLYNATQNGTANVSDYVSGATLAQEYATNYNDTGFYAYLVGFSATQGMAIPDLENTSLMTIQTATDTYQGLLMSQEAPSSGVWEVGVTYHTADIGGKQFVATTDGQLVELEGEFSITSMEGPDGESINSTTSQEFNYTVTNESPNYLELQEDLRALRTEIENIEPLGGSGGGAGGFGFNLGTSGLVVIAAGAAAVLLFGRN